MTIKSRKQCSSAQKRIRDVSELMKWMIEVQRGLRQTAIDQAHNIYLQACVYLFIYNGIVHEYRDRRFQRLL